MKTKEFTIQVSESYKKRTCNEIAKLDKKLSKYGTNVIVKSTVDFMHEVSKGCFEERVRFTLEVPVSRVGKQGVSYLGLVSYDDNIPHISSETSDYNLFTYIPKNRVAVCDHCGSKRDRVKYFFFLENNEVKIIGSTCVKEYFGIDVEQVLNTIEGFCHRVDNFTNTRGVSYMSTSFLLRGLSYVTVGFSLNWEKGVTASTIYEALRVATNPRDSREEEMASEILGTEITAEQTNRILKFWDIDPKNDFEFNIVAIFNDPKNFPQFVPTSTTGIFLWACWKALNTPDKEVEVAGVSKFVGQVKEKLNLTLTLVRTFCFDNEYGIIYIHKFVDINGNIFVWKTRNTLDWYNEETKEPRDAFVGNIIILKGTVKEHSEYRDEKQTILTRCKVLEIKGATE